MEHGQAVPPLPCYLAKSLEVPRCLVVHERDLVLLHLIEVDGVSVLSVLNNVKAQAARLVLARALGVQQQFFDVLVMMFELDLAGDQQDTQIVFFSAN